MANASITPSLVDIPNPFTPMAWLPPDIAYQVTIISYVLVGALAVLVWDIITHLRDDWNLLARYKINFPTITYLTSRWSSLLHTTLSVTLRTAPIKKCGMLATVTCAIYYVAVSSTALLFFFRVRALFNKNKYITVTFFIMWLGVLGGTLTAIPSRGSTRLGPTKYCAISGFKAYGSAPSIAIAIFDTCVFLAIQWRILLISHAAANTTGPIKSKLKIFGSKPFSAFSTALLQDGQQYYMVAMVSNLLVLIWNYMDSFPPACRIMFVVPSMVLTNIMGCRVFRHTKLGHYMAEGPPISNIMFQRSNRPMQVSAPSQADVLGISGSTTMTESGTYEAGITSNVVLPNEPSREGDSVV